MPIQMAVGEFEYSQLEDSQYIMGPMMFWGYILLVYFILMSVFIALIAEAYQVYSLLPMSLDMLKCVSLWTMIICRQLGTSFMRSRSNGYRGVRHLATSRLWLRRYAKGKNCCTICR